MNVHTKLVNARQIFHSKKLKKTGHNKFAGYDYFELGDFLIPALESMAECGLSAFISFDETMAKLTIVNCEKPEEQILITSPMSTCEMKGLHKVQQLGAVQTYLRRYLWVAALEIIEHDGLNMTQSEGKPSGFDVLEALDLVEASLTLEGLEKVWKEQSTKARKAQNRGGYDALMAAVNDKKAELSK